MYVDYYEDYYWDIKNIIEPLVKPFLFGKKHFVSQKKRVKYCKWLSLFFHTFLFLIINSLLLLDNHLYTLIQRGRSKKLSEKSA